jgi:hypothetical protein
MFSAQIQGLEVATAVEVPNMQAMTILSSQEFLAEYAALNHPWGSPFATDKGIVPQMPPEIVVQILIAAINLPPSKHF